MTQTFYIRFLPPGELGNGEIVHCASISRPEEWTLAAHRESYPRVFERPGFYHMLAGLEERVMVS